MSKKVLGIHFLNFLRFFCFVLERLMGVMLRWRQNTPILCQSRSPRAPWGPPYSGGGSAQLTLTSVTAKGGLWDPGGGGGEVHACSFAGEVTHTGPGSQAHSWEPAQV